MNSVFNLKSKIWLYQGKGAWHFLTLPEKEASYIEKNFAHLQRGWGSFKVQVTIGSTTWLTSIFKDKKSNSYLLPIKKDVRQKEGLNAASLVNYKLEILEG